MAAETGLSPQSLDPHGSNQVVKPEPRQVMEPDELMERLRNRSHQHRSWMDSIKAVKMAVVGDKRNQSDVLEKPVLQSYLDTLHKALKVVTREALIERLESIARQLGMTITPPSTTENHMFLAAEMFHIDIQLDGQGAVQDVKIGHQETPTTCEELTEILSKGNFEEFMMHMEGYLSIYKISGDKKQKFKAYLALNSLESDLNVLAQLQSSINGVANYIHKSPLGILLPRKGGQPMKLIYYVSPYDLLCKKTKSSYPMTVEAITENDLGHSVTVCLEPSQPNRLQTMPLLSVKTHSQDGKRLPSFQTLNNMNSSSLPASFVLVLPQPIPVSMSVKEAIEEITGLDVICGEETPLMSLILDFATGNKITEGQELYVTLPDQHHVYYLNRLSEGCLGQKGVSLARIPFTHPTCVSQVLNQLRQQHLFNTVIQSLIRPSAIKDPQTSLVFELTAVSLQYISVMFEHPLHASMVTVELDLSDITSMKCRTCTGTGDETICSDEFISRAFQRCFSIPITLRAIIQKVREEIKKLIPPEPIVPEPVKVAWQPDISNKNNSSASIPRSMDMLSLQSSFELRKLPMLNRTFLEPLPPDEFHDRPPANPLLATLLDQGSPPSDPPPPTASPMLSKLLEENTSVAINTPAFPPPKQKRIAKRKSSKDLSSGRSPKHRLSELEMSDRERHVDLDSSGGSSMSDSDHPGRPPSANSVGSVGPVSSTGSVIDLTDPVTPDQCSMESHVRKLENFIQNESRVNPTMPHNYPPMQQQLQHQQPQSGSEIVNLLQSFPQDMDQEPHIGATQMPISRNSPHHVLVPKNEVASTSLEDSLIGSGDSRANVDPTPLHVRRNSQLARMANFKRQNSLNSMSRSSIDSMTGGGVSPDIVFSPGLSPVNTTHIKMEVLNSVDSKAGIVAMGGYNNIAAGLVQGSQTVFTSSSTGKPSLQTLKAHYDLKNEVSNLYNCQERDVFKTEDVSVTPVMKLKLSAMKQYDSVSPPESEDSKSRTSAFDFHSDDEEFLPVLEKNMTVTSASPTRLQISNKTKVSHNLKFSKSEKYKRKESKHNSSSESGKRKRDKEEGRKERKKKKSAAYISTDGAVYKSTPVQAEGDGENNIMPKLKITKHGGKLSLGNSIRETKSEKDNVKDKNMHSRSVSMDQGIFDRIESMKHEHLSKNASVDGCPPVRKNASSKSQKAHKSHQRSMSSGVTLTKSDSKLARTPTIKLKPIAVPTTSSSVMVSGARTPTTPSGPPTPTMPKAIVSASPTSATIGKIGAVSFATSGSQKSMPSNKSPQGAGKISNSSNKGSIAALLTSKSSSGSLLKSGSASGKNSPNNQNKVSNSAGRSSSSSHSQGTGKSSSSSGRTGSSSGKTSSPLSSAGRNSSSSSMRNSSSSSRDKSTSSKNNVTPVTTVITQQTAASVLSFLNPKASSIASLPPIPKKSSAAGNVVKNNSLNSNPSFTPSITASTTTPPTTSVSSSKTNAFTSSSASATSSSPSNFNTNKGMNSHSKPNNQTNATGQARLGSLPSHCTSSNAAPKSNSQSNSNFHNRNSVGTPNSVRGNGPISAHKGTGYSPTNNTAHTNSNRVGSSTPSSQSTTNTVSNVNSTYKVSSNQLPSESGGSHVTSKSSVSPALVTASATPTTKTSNSVSDSASINSSSNRGNNNNNSGSSPNVRKTGGTPTVKTTVPQAVSNSNRSDDQIKSSAPALSATAQTSADAGSSSNSAANQVSAALRARKGSLSAVIDKLTCKASTTGVPSGKDLSTVHKADQGEGKEKLVVPAERKERSNSEGGVSNLDLSNNTDSNSASAVSVSVSSSVSALAADKHVQDVSVGASESSDQIPNKTSSSAAAATSEVLSAKSVIPNSKVVRESPGKSGSSEGTSQHSGSVSSYSSASAKMTDRTNGNSSQADQTRTTKTTDANERVGQSCVQENCQGELPSSQVREEGSVTVGSSSDSGKTVCSGEKTKDNVFKVPTPKQSTPEDNKDQEDIENLVVRRKVRTSSKPIQSPGSPCSSPENGLIIDCPSSPRHLQNKTNSPQCNPDLSLSENRPSNWKSLITHSPKLKPSPIHSPVSKELSNPNSVGNVNSPCIIDDDLMDEALVL